MKLIATNKHVGDNEQRELLNVGNFVNAEEIKNAIFDYLANCNGVDIEEYADGSFVDFDDMLKHTELMKREDNGVMYFKIVTTKGTYQIENLDWNDDKEFSIVLESKQL